MRPNGRLGILVLVLLLSASTSALARQVGETAEPTPAHNPATRLIFGSTARMPAPGSGELVGFEAYSFTLLNAGVTRRVSLGVGMSPFSVFCLCQTGIVVAPKFQLLERGRLSMAAGVTHVLVPDNRDLGYRYVVATFGSADTAITVGAGQMHRGSSDRAVLTIGAERRLNTRVVWVTENHVHADGVMTSGGFRIHGTHWSVDLALAWFLQKDFLIVPAVNVTRSF